MSVSKEECEICQGKEPSKFFPKRCEEHDVCDTCGIKRKDLKETPWGTRNGWRCKPCEEERQKQAVEDYKPNWKDEEYGDEPRCPYCGHEYYIDDHYSLYEDDNYEKLECSNCGKEFNCETYVSRNYTCTRLKREKVQKLR